MADYHVWHPSYLPGGYTIDAFVTEGEASFLSTGTDEVFADIAAALALTGQVTGWHMVPVRSHYFGSYREDSADWRERWKLAWWIQLGVDPPTPLPVEPPYGFFDLQTIDATYLSTTSPSTWEAWTCAVIATARDLDHLAALEAAAFERFPWCSMYQGEAFGGYPQLRCILGEYPQAFYEGGADEVEALVAALAALGGRTRFHPARE